MNFLSDAYYKSLAKNEENLRFWENHLQNLKSLDFSVYAEKLKVPVLVPVGSRVFFRGSLKHTNEVYVALGADYFVKCSLAQAEVLRQHRIKGAEAKVEEFLKERAYIQNQLFGTESVLKDQGEQIIEEYNEEEDLKWRVQHRENMRHYKQSRKTEESKEEIDDEELWNRLEELELQEELEAMVITENIPDEPIINKLKRDSANMLNSSHEDKPIQDNRTNDEPIARNLEHKNYRIKEKQAPTNNCNLELLQQVIDKQNELKEKLTDLKNKETTASKTEKDLLSRLDEMEQLDDLEDEMYRIDDILQTEDVEESDEKSEEQQNLKLPAGKVKRSVSFADEDDSETLELTFTHSETEPDTTPYDKEKGITKPSDIYEAFSKASETTSILKKSKYDRDLSPCGPRVEKRTKVDDFQEAQDNRQMNRTIVVNDVVEKVDENDNNFECGEKRPMSLFKKRRQQNLK